MRKVEVIDADSPVVKANLGGVMALPVIWIYGRDGVLIEKIQDKTNAQILARIEAALNR